MSLGQHPLYRLFARLCDLNTALQEAGVPARLVQEHDALIDYLAGLMLAQCHDNDAAPLCPTCGGPLSEETTPCDG